MAFHKNTWNLKYSHQSYAISRKKENRKETERKKIQKIQNYFLCKKIRTDKKIQNYVLCRDFVRVLSGFCQDGNCRGFVGVLEGFCRDTIIPPTVLQCFKVIKNTFPRK